jgi:hypothetical protein
MKQASSSFLPTLVRVDPLCFRSGGVDGVDGVVLAGCRVIADP